MQRTGVLGVGRPMTTQRVPHVVTVAEQTKYAAICVSCPWTSEGHDDPDWAEHAAEQHEKGHSRVPEEEGT